MSNRSPGRLPVLYAPITLPNHFPCVGGGLFVQTDKPISYLHLHDCVELGICHDGAGIFMVDNKVLPFAAGDVSVITQKEVHLARSVQGTISRWTWVYLDPSRLVGPACSDSKRLDPSTLCGPKFSNVIPPRHDAALAPLLRTLIDELVLQPDGWQQSVRGLTWSFMCRLQRLPNRSRPAKPHVRSTPAIERLAPALETMLHRHGGPLSMRQLARQCHMSHATFRRAFHTGVGHSPTQYLARLRIEMAKVLLGRDGKPISQIALEVGYPTLSGFNRYFKRIVGMPPREYRDSLG